MASYTMPLSEYIEMWTQDDDTLTTRDRIETGRTHLFDFDYPLWSADYKKDFETKFIRNFYFTEIGFETEAQFKFRLETWLDINMPYFNQLFQSELIEFDPLTNTKIDTTSNKTLDRTQHDQRDVTNHSTLTGTDQRDVTNHSTTSGTSNTTNDGTSHVVGSTINDGTENVDDSRFDRHLESDTPDSRLTITPNADGSGTIEYASRITEDKETDSRDITKHATGSNDDLTTDHATSDVTASSETNGTVGDTLTKSNETNGTVGDTLDSTIHETDAETKNQTGKIGSQTYSQMLTEYRETFLRIEKQIFSEMRKELFMLVY